MTALLLVGAIYLVVITWAAVILVRHRPGERPASKARCP